MSVREHLRNRSTKKGNTDLLRVDGQIFSIYLEINNELINIEAILGYYDKSAGDLIWAKNVLDIANVFSYGHKNEGMILYRSQDNPVRIKWLNTRYIIDIT